MRVSRDRTSFRGRNQVASCRYFVPSGTRRRSWDDDALGENERLDGDNKRRRSQQQEARKSYSGFRIENRAIESAACFIFCSFFLPLPFSSLPFLVAYRIIHTRVKRDARASARWRQTYRSPRDGTPLTAWPSSRSNASSFRSRFRSTLGAASSSFFFLVFTSRRREKNPQRRLGFYSFTASILNITLAPSAFLPSFLFCSFSFSLSLTWLRRLFI